MKKRNERNCFIIQNFDVAQIMKITQVSGKKNATVALDKAGV